MIGARYLGSVSSYHYPEDEFDVGEDDGPVPVGVHRAQVPRWRSWIPLLAILIIVPALGWGVVALIGGGSGGSGGSGGGQAASQAPAGGGTPTADGKASSEGSAAASPSATAEGSADLTMGITVHNGTTITGLAGRTGDRLTNSGFTAVTVSQGTYDASEPTATTIYYRGAEERATAEAVGKALGITELVEDTAATESNPIVVILREDFSESDSQDGGSQGGSQEGGSQGDSQGGGSQDGGSQGGSQEGGAQGGSGQDSSEGNQGQ